MSKIINCKHGISYFNFISWAFIIISICCLRSICYAAWAPPIDTPLAIKLHPRLLFIPENYRTTHPDAMGITVSEMREKLISFNPL